MVEFLDESFILIISIMGTVLTFLSILLGATWKSRALHISYAALIVATAYLMSSYYLRLGESLELAQAELDTVLEIRSQAGELFDSMYEGSDPGRNRGNLLMAISFFETYSDRYPKAYEILLSLSDQAELSRVYSQRDLFAQRDQQEALDQAGDAARELVRGIAVGVK